MKQFTFKIGDDRMKEYEREYPIYALCGLNCGLCARYQTEGESKCPGCGGLNFHMKHPSCSVIACSKKHNNVEFCSQCDSYPCGKYVQISPTDSFISYKNVQSDFEKAKNNGIESYISELKEKMSILGLLIEKYNDGRRKSFYCTAVNLISLHDLQEIMNEIQRNPNAYDNPNHKSADRVVSLFNDYAAQRNIHLKLRK